MFSKLALIAIATLFPLSTFAAEWKPTSSPLFTKWGKQVQPDKVHPEYPRPQLVRKDWQNLNGLWEFGSGDGTSPIQLNEQILVPFPPESALSGIGKHADYVQYRRSFTVPGGWNGKRILLHFGAVDWETTVSVNKKVVGSHRGGYDPFSFDITDALNGTGEQVLEVAVYDPSDKGEQPRGKQVEKPRGIWYVPTTGIWQTVWLEPVAENAIKNLELVPDVDAGVLRLRVDSGRPGAKITAEAFSGSSSIAKIEGETGADVELKIQNAKLWSPENPHLYDLKLRIEDGGKVIDEVQSYFAMRKIEVGQEEGITRILLNGKFTFQMGPLDQGFWPDGLYTPPSDEALKFDIELSKRLGFNMIRKHVKVEPARWYYWTDKLGMLVWQDMPSAWVKTDAGKKQFELEWKNIMDALRNHPSIVAWVVFNEGWGQYDTERLTAWTKEHDPTRLTINASGWVDKNVGDIIDMHKYPGPGSPQPEPKRAAVLGEFGGLGLKVEGHMWTQEHWGYQGTTSSEQLTKRYEQLMRRVWMLKDDPGMSAAVYTQITDVETEANGLITYDREVVKVDEKRIRDANQGRLSPVKIEVVVPTSEKIPLTWRYTFEKPDKEWTASGFDDSNWKQGPAGFGSEKLGSGVVRTDWNTTQVWLRREVELPARSYDDLYFLVLHDDDVEIYLNGVRAAREKGARPDYEELVMSDEARATLKPGKNTIAVMCRNTGGPQYIDVGLISVKEDTGSKR